MIIKLKQRFTDFVSDCVEQDVHEHSVGLGRDAVLDLDDLKKLKIKYFQNNVKLLITSWAYPCVASVPQAPRIFIFSSLSLFLSLAPMFWQPCYPLNLATLPPEA